MTKQPETSRVRIELTQPQREQIRKATGREVKRLELRLQGWPEPAVMEIRATTERKKR